MKERPCRTIVDSGNEQSHFEDEALETMWEMREHGEVLYDEVLREMGSEERLLRMQDDALIMVRDGRVTLTDDGECRARDITRRHRLAERLFADVLDLDDYEEDACRFEHAISAEVEEAICTLLGHPPLCPHGKPIPKGRCCDLYTRKVRPLVQNLRDLEVGRTARVLFITVPGVSRLGTIGLVPGTELKLLQKRPSFVLQIDETTVAIDEDIARGIYVKQK